MPEATAEAAGAASLSDVFPGETVRLRSLGRDVLVREWGAAALVREVPAKMGRIMARLVPFAGQMRGGGLERILPAFLSAAGEDFAGLVLWSAGLEEAELQRISGGDLMKIAAAVVRQNRDFFAALGGLWAALGIELPGPASPPP